MKGRKWAIQITRQTVGSAICIAFSIHHLHALGLQAQHRTLQRYYSLMEAHGVSAQWQIHQSGLLMIWFFSLKSWNTTVFDQAIKQQWFFHYSYYLSAMSSTLNYAFVEQPFLKHNIWKTLSCILVSLWNNFSSIYIFKPGASDLILWGAYNLHVSYTSFLDDTQFWINKRSHLFIPKHFKKEKYQI